MDLSALADALDALAPQILDVCHAPGMSVAIGTGEDVVLAKGYGLADVEAGRPMTADTVGPTGSDGKTYTAAAIMQLVERGLIGVDDPINDHLGGLTVTNPLGARPITLRDLLTHRSGLGTGFGNCAAEPPAPLGEHLERVFAEQRGDVYGGLLPFWATPVGTNYQYSNLGVALIGRLVELLNPAGVPFGEWVRRHVFVPLGMTSSCFPLAQHPDHVPEQLWARRSVGYATLGGMRLRLPPVYVGDHPAGTALTTPSDHVRFLLSMATGGRVLAPATAARMISPQAARGPDPTAAVGFIWNVFDHGSAAGYIGHGGEYMWGWHQVSRCWPQRRIAVSANVNQWDLGDLGASDRPSHLAGRLVLGIVTAWTEGLDPRPLRDPAAARSYLAGLLVGDRLTARLGIRTPPPPAVLAGIADTAAVPAGTPWDPEAFRAGMADLTVTDGTLPALAGLLGSELPAHHLDLLRHQLGVPNLGFDLA